MTIHSFEKKYGKIKGLATPLDEIIENHLRLTCEIVPMDPRILGFLDVQENSIKINSILDPTENQRAEGRYNFTLAHEAGHNILHRPYVEALMEMPVLPEQEVPNIILCRKADRREPIEVQADKCGAALLMPRAKVFQAYAEKCGGKIKPVSIEELVYVTRKDRRFMDELFRYGSGETSTDDILRAWFGSMAAEFKVSATAMVIRRSLNPSGWCQPI